MALTVRLAFLLLLPFLLCGCFDLDEEVWIRPDGSARYRCEIEEPAKLLGELGPSIVARARADLDGLPAVQSLTSETTVEGDRRRTVLDVELAPGAAGGELLARQGFAFERTSAGWRFERRLGGKREAEAKERDPLAELFARQLMERNHYQLTLHAPRIVRSNGDLDAGGTSVTWRMSLLDAAESSVLSAELADAEPAGWGSLLLGLVGLGVAGVLLLKRLPWVGALVAVVTLVYLVLRFGLLRGGFLALAWAPVALLTSARGA